MQLTNKLNLKHKELYEGPEIETKLQNVFACCRPVYSDTLKSLENGVVQVMRKNDSDM